MARILIIEDDEEIRDLLDSLLSREGHVVATAAMPIPSHCWSASLAATASLAPRHDHSSDSRYSAASFGRGESA